VYEQDYWPVDYLPQGIEPKSKEAALYYFYFVQIDYQTRGDRLVKCMRSFFSARPELLSAETIAELSLEELARIIKACGGRFPTRDNLAWKENSKILVERFDGDPRKIGRKVTIKELQERTASFRKLGAHGKLFWLWTSIMVDVGSWEILDIENFLVPVDVWIYRWACKLGICSGSYSKKTQETVGKFLARLCLQEGLPVTKINHILWKYLRSKREI